MSSALLNAVFLVGPFGPAYGRGSIFLLDYVVTLTWVKPPSVRRATIPAWRPR